MTDLSVPFKWSQDPKDFRDRLPDDKDNYIVDCKRCKGTHRYYTFTKQDFDNMVREGAQKLADTLDSQIEEAVFGKAIA